MKPNFFKIFDLAFLVPHEFEPTLTKEAPVKSEENIAAYQDRKEEILDKYLDAVFGNKSKLPRAEWEKLTVSDTGNWIFSGKSLRKEIDSTLFAAAQ